MNGFNFMSWFWYMTSEFIAAYKSLKDTKCLNIAEIFTILSCQNNWKGFYSDMIDNCTVHYSWLSLFQFESESVSA